MHIYTNRVYLFFFFLQGGGGYIKIGSDFTSEWGGGGGGYTEIWVVLHTKKVYSFNLKV